MSKNVVILKPGSEVTKGKAKVKLAHLI